MFIAQLLSLIGSGLATIALGLLARDLAEASAGVILGTALAIKMIAYVVVSPFATAISVRIPRKTFLVVLDLLRAGLVLAFPFASSLAHVYILILLLYAITAGFTPVFQAGIADIVTDDKNYIKALSLSRLAFNTENIISPIVAGLLLSVLTFNWIFVFTSIGFVGSAMFIAACKKEKRIHSVSDQSFVHRLTAGVVLFWQIPRLQGLFVLNLSIALVGANVLVNSIVIADFVLFGGEQTYLQLLLVYGLGSFAAAFLLQYFMTLIGLRLTCLSAAFLVSTASALLWINPTFTGFYVTWALIGFGMSLITTSSGLIIRSSSSEQDRPAIFAAQFSLSHACWLLTYPLVGWLGKEIGPVNVLFLTSGFAFIISILAIFIWKTSKSDP